MLSHTLPTYRGHHIYTPPPALGLEKIRKWLVYTISWWICKLPQHTAVCIYTTTGAVVVYIESVVLLGTLHIRQEMVYTSHLCIFFRPKTGGGAYIYIYMVCLSSGIPVAFCFGSPFHSLQQQFKTARGCVWSRRVCFCIGLVCETGKTSMRSIGSKHF